MLKSVTKPERATIVVTSTIKVLILLRTAVSDPALWFGLATIALKSAGNTVRTATIAKSTAKV